MLLVFCLCPLKTWQSCLSQNSHINTTSIIQNAHCHCVHCDLASIVGLVYTQVAAYELSLLYRLL